jgi:bifunctional non-homologous end joining protein LigD
LPAAIREGEAEDSPYLAIDDVGGLAAMAQISAIELHAWGATEADPLHPDQAVFDLDPGEGVAFTDVVQAAHDVRAQLQRLKLESFCRTTGGKGLHVVVPLDPAADWDTVKPFCRAFAETMSNEQPDRYLPTMKKADRRGKILIDWLRNGLGATAVASFCPRARPGATVAMPLAWDAVNRKLDPAKFTLRSVPDQLRRQRSDPWEGFATMRQRLPNLTGETRSAARPSSRLRRLHAEAYQRHAAQVQPLPGARELLQHLQNTAIPCAIATSGRMETARVNIEALGIDPARTPVVTRDQVKYAKPNPDLF